MIYLASQSPRRRQLLDQLGIVHELLLPSADEDAEALEATQPDEPPADYVQRVTRAKLSAAQQRRRQRGLRAAPILCADTTVALGMRILGKPVDAADALAMLKSLGGQVHQVHTAVAVASPGGEVVAALSSSSVWFADVPETALQAYVDSGEPFGKAGAYAIQGRFAEWIARIDGSHSGIMGLPLFETAALLRTLES
ncbi:MAG: Maf family protein [Inhella sp.]|jgi:septum formation protein